MSIYFWYWVISLSAEERILTKIIQLKFSHTETKNFQRIRNFRNKNMLRTQQIKVFTIKTNIKIVFQPESISAEKLG